MIRSVLSHFPGVIQDLRGVFLRSAYVIEPERWQGVNVSGNPAARVHELRNVVFEVKLEGVENLDYWRGQIEPNLPWADDHFEERVGGQPLNPGVQWQNWPWGKSADRFRDKDEIFNHTYMERYWPTYARKRPGGESPPEQEKGTPHTYLGQPLGDLNSLVGLLAQEPTTRQAWLPIFFPSDTGYGDGGRKPCTLGYQFLCRDKQVHIWYPLRSCDFVRHFRDDCYLTVRLLLWVLNQCRGINPDYWNKVRVGTYSMHCTSLHVFENDMIQMRK